MELYSADTVQTVQRLEMSGTYALEWVTLHLFSHGDRWWGNIHIFTDFLLQSIVLAVGPRPRRCIRRHLQSFFCTSHIFHVYLFIQRTSRYCTYHAELLMYIYLWIHITYNIPYMYFVLSYIVYGMYSNRRLLHSNVNCRVQTFLFNLHHIILL